MTPTKCLAEAFRALLSRGPLSLFGLCIAVIAAVLVVHAEATARDSRATSIARMDEAGGTILIVSGDVDYERCERLSKYVDEIAASGSVESVGRESVGPTGTRVGINRASPGFLRLIRPQVPPDSLRASRVIVEGPRLLEIVGPGAASFPRSGHSTSIHQSVIAYSPVAWLGDRGFDLFVPTLQSFGASSECWIRAERSDLGSIGPLAQALVGRTDETLLTQPALPDSYEQIEARYLSVSRTELLFASFFASLAAASAFAIAQTRESVVYLSCGIDRWSVLLIDVLHNLLALLAASLSAVIMSVAVSASARVGLAEAGSIALVVIGAMSGGFLVPAFVASLFVHGRWQRAVSAG